MSVQVLYTAHAVASGGRNGHTETRDGLLKADLSVPKAMGGPGKPGTTTPEDFFAAGYAACFGGAVDYMATQMKLKPSSLEVEAAVGIGKDASGVGLKVDLTVWVSGLSEADAQKIVEAGHQFCPYSKATRKKRRGGAQDHRGLNGRVDARKPPSLPREDFCFTPPWQQAGVKSPRFWRARCSTPRRSRAPACARAECRLAARSR